MQLQKIGKRFLSVIIFEKNTIHFSWKTPYFDFTLLHFDQEKASKMKLLLKEHAGLIGLPKYGYVKWMNLKGMYLWIRVKHFESDDEYEFGPLFST